MAENRASAPFISSASSKQSPVEQGPLGEQSPVRLKKLGHVVVLVSDLERSTRFYTEVLNMRVSDRGADGSVFLNAVGDHHTIALFPAGAGTAGPTSQDAESQIAGARLHHFAMEVEDLDALFEIRAYLQARGVPIVWQGRRLFGGHVSVEFLDPDGFHLELYCEMDRIGEDNRTRPADRSQVRDTLEAARDHPKSPTW